MTDCDDNYYFETTTHDYYYYYDNNYHYYHYHYHYPYHCYYYYYYYYWGGGEWWYVHPPLPLPGGGVVVRPNPPRKQGYGELSVLGALRVLLSGWFQIAATSRPRLAMDRITDSSGSEGRCPFLNDCRAPGEA